MSKLEDFEDIPYEDERRYTPKELEEYIKMEKDSQKEQFNCTISEMKEEYEKKILTIQDTYNGAINTLREENEFYKNIIKSVLHIKE